MVKHKIDSQCCTKKQTHINRNIQCTQTFVTVALSSLPCEQWSPEPGFVLWVLSDSEPVGLPSCHTSRPRLYFECVLYDYDTELFSPAGNETIKADALTAAELKRLNMMPSSGPVSLPNENGVYMLYSQFS